MVDVVDLLRELNFEIDPWDMGSWLLRAPDGGRYPCKPLPAMDRITSEAARFFTGSSETRRVRPLLVGRTITTNMLERASRGELDVITERPLQLIVRGRVYSDDAHEVASRPLDVLPRPRRGRRAWIRWATMRCLLLASGPLRQSEIAAVLGSSQQAVSLAIKQLAGLVHETEAGFLADDKQALLQEWLLDYEGPNGQGFGWYSLNPVVEQTEQAVKVAALYDVDPLITGDVAADKTAPWKLPSVGRIYVKNPIDLAGDGFVPAPLVEATLVTCVPQDPTIWKLVDVAHGMTSSDVPLADPVIVYWDVLHGEDVDSLEAAQKLARNITG